MKGKGYYVLDNCINYIEFHLPVLGNKKQAFYINHNRLLYKSNQSLPNGKWAQGKHEQGYQPHCERC